LWHDWLTNELVWDRAGNWRARTLYLTSWLLARCFSNLLLLLRMSGRRQENIALRVGTFSGPSLLRFVSVFLSFSCLLIAGLRRTLIIVT
jgi:hypothetical protein